MVSEFRVPPGNGVPCARAVLLLLLVAASLPAAPTTTRSPAVFDVRDYGAVGDGEALDTQAIQAAIDASAREGGGRVYLAGGTYRSGTIKLQSHVTLYVEAGATLLASADLKDYPVTVPAYRSYTDNYTDKSLIYAEDVENISLLGRGVIDGQGKLFEGHYKARPFTIRVIECKNVMVRGLTIRNSPMWVQHYLACENVTIDGITVHSRVNLNNDGIDIDSCDKVRIANCEISTGDDAIVLKSTSGRICKNVTVTNCILSSYCNALKCGTESNGGFQNITISNCTIYDTRLVGIALELVDGGSFDRVMVSNIAMDDVKGGIFIRLGNRGRPYLARGRSKGEFTLEAGAKRPGMGSMRNIVISNVQARGVGEVGCSITGLPGHPVENVTLDNIRMEFDGGGTIEHAEAAVPEKPDSYPEFSMFGTLPAYGLYCRHARNVRFRTLELAFDKADHRPALIFDDVEGVDLFGIDAESSASARALIWMNQVNGALVHGCRVSHGDTTFLRLDGDKTTNICLKNNALSQVARVLEQGKEVGEDAVSCGK